MANIKISELNELTQKENNDFLPIVDSSANETKKISVGNLTPSNDKLVHVGTEVDEDYRVNVLYSKNLFNKNNIVSGKGLNADDTTYTEASRSYLDYTEVKASTTYSTGNITWKVLNFLNSSKQVISSLNTGVSSFTTPANTKYIRMSFDNTLGWEDAQIQEESSIITPSIYADNEEIYSKEDVLYSGNDNTATQINLKNSIKDYSYIEIYYRNSWLFTSIKIVPNATSIPLTIIYGSSTNGITIHGSVWEVISNGTGLRLVDGRDRDAFLSTSSSYNATRQVYITKVVGYK